MNGHAHLHSFEMAAEAALEEHHYADSEPWEENELEQSSDAYFSTDLQRQDAPAQSELENIELARASKYINQHLQQLSETSISKIPGFFMKILHLGKCSFLYYYSRQKNGQISTERRYCCAFFRYQRE